MLDIQQMVGKPIWYPLDLVKGTQSRDFNLFKASQSNKSLRRELCSQIVMKHVKTCSKMEKSFFG